MNICTKFHNNPSNYCCDISVWTKVVDQPTLPSIDPCCCTSSGVFRSLGVQQPSFIKQCIKSSLVVIESLSGSFSLLSVETERHPSLWLNTRVHGRLIRHLDPSCFCSQPLVADNRLRAEPLTAAMYMLSAGNRESQTELKVWVTSCRMAGLWLCE